MEVNGKHREDRRQGIRAVFVDRCANGVGGCAEALSL
jgi:hypothetical protein